ncbi:MAG: gamma-glutamylcyclotransferase [Methanosarcinaceae archaeon]|nr:gamma-glutamylcyclotransferase [Methanosarcinaceae archaeon]
MDKLLENKDVTKTINDYDLLFVYGTLRKSGSLHKLYLTDAIYSTTIKLSGVKLYESQLLPVAVLTKKDKHKIKGELYYVLKTDMLSIDRLESSYRKVKLTVAISGYSEKQEVIMYVKKTTEIINLQPYRIKSGDWILHQKIFEDKVNKMCEEERFCM